MLLAGHMAALALVIVAAHLLVLCHCVLSPCVELYYFLARMCANVSASRACLPSLPFACSSFLAKPAVDIPAFFAFAENAPGRFTTSSRGLPNIVPAICSPRMVRYPEHIVNRAELVKDFLQIVTVNVRNGREQLTGSFSDRESTSCRQGGTSNNHTFSIGRNSHGITPAGRRSNGQYGISYCN